MVSFRPSRDVFRIGTPRLDDIGIVTELQSKTLQKEALEHLVRATSGRATVADLRELASWRQQSSAHAEAYRRATMIWEALEKAAGESVTATDRAMIAGQAFAGDPRAVSRRAVLLGGGIAAAAVAMTAVEVIRPPLGLWPSLSDLMADYRTERGEQRTVALADGISVEMNTSTSIARRLTSDRDERIELLSGEAWIATAPGASKMLTVVAADGRVLAARTQLNLRHDADEVRVTCLEGSVQVECRGNVAALRAGQQLVYTTQSFGQPAMVDPTEVIGWREGLLTFHDEPLARVLDEVNRYWRGRIVLLNGDLGRRRVTIRIELARVEEVISYVRIVMGAHVRTLPGGVVVLT
jgi:transmembrane sensor